MVQATSPLLEPGWALPLAEILLERDGGWIFLSAWAKVPIPAGISLEMAHGNMVVSLDAGSRITKARRRESAPSPVSEHSGELVIRARTASGSVELSRGPVPRWVSLQPLSVLCGR